MIVAILLAMQSSGDAKLVEPPIPEPIVVKIAEPLNYQFRYVSKPIDDQRPNKDGSMDWKIGKTVIHFPRKHKGWSVWRAIPGKDGSVIVSEGQDGYSFDEQSFVITNPPHKKLIATTYEPQGWYLDARNSAYVANFEDDLASLLTAGPPILHVKTNGLDLEYGAGEPLLFWSPDEILTKVPLDEDNNPTTREFTAKSYLRLYLKRKPIEIGDFHLIRALADHTLVIDRQPHDHAVIFGGSDDLIDVYTWKDGHFLTGYRLPNHWEPVIANDNGDILVRYRSRSPYGNDSEYEMQWKMGILRDGAITPILFNKPNSTDSLYWRNTQSFDNADKIRFSAFFGSHEEFYALTPTKQTSRK
jgi:hypothetical protein